MILFKWNYIKEIEPEIPHIGLRQWINAIEIEKWHIAIVKFVRFQNLANNKWCKWKVIAFNGIGFSKYFKFGADHMYYDGPHCIYSLGWFHVWIDPESCKKCEVEK